MSSSPAPSPERPVRPKWRIVVFWMIAIAAFVPTAFGFLFKFYRMVQTQNSVEGGGFTLIPISNYLFMALGFICLLAYAVLNGMFRDVEGPKYTMLQHEEELDRQDLLEGRSAHHG